MSDIVTQYRIFTDGAGWAETRRGRLRFDGRDRTSFLQALLTNDVASLARGQGVYAAYLTPQGRMLTDLRVYHRGDYLIADVPSGQAASLAARFDALIFTEEVRVTDISATLGQLTVVGGAAEAVLARALSLDLELLRALPVLAQLDAGDLFIARTDAAPYPSFDVFVGESTRPRLTERLEEAGARAISDELVETLRIEAGRPAFGIDMTEETIPLEAGLLDRAISTTKGCYVGQEIIVRVLHRGGGRVARRLVTLAFEPSVGAPPAAGAPLSIDGRDVGRLTSVAFSPQRQRLVALGYVRRDAAEPGRRVTVATAAGPVEAEITGFGG